MAIRPIVRILGKVHHDRSATWLPQRLEDELADRAEGVEDAVASDGL
jgi:hypothetical protein